MASTRRPFTAKNLGLSGMNPSTPARHSSDGSEDATINARQPPPLAGMIAQPTEAE
jgi:hypothetical protein